MTQKKATIIEIAAKLDITPSTVSRALNNHPRISEDTRKKVKKAAKDLNYQPNNLAAALRSGKSKLIGVIVPTINRNFFSSVIRGIEEVANTFDYKVIITQTNEVYENEVKTVDALLNARVDGIIASLGKNSENLDHYNKVLLKKIPLVLFDRTSMLLETSQVVIDDYYAAYTITEQLIQQGYRRIAHFTNPKKINIYSERLRGYTDALKDNNIPFDSALVVDSNLQLEDGVKSMEYLLSLSKKPDAVFSASDYAAMGAMQVLKQHQIKIPDHIALAGFGNEPFTLFTEPPLTTVDQRSIAMGNVAARLFFEKLENDYKKSVSQRTVLKPEVLIRASTLKKAE